MPTSYKHIGSMINPIAGEVLIILTKTEALVVNTDLFYRDDYETIWTSGVYSSWDIHINENDMVECLYGE